MTRREASQRARREREVLNGAPTRAPTRSDFGTQHGPWRRGGAMPRMKRIVRLPLRTRYIARTRRDAVRTLARLVFEDPIALALWEAL